jgi:hypothetical protein
MWFNEKQKIYTSEEQRRKDEQQGNQPKESLLEVFNGWASEKTAPYRRAAQRAAAEFEFQIENSIEQSGETSLNKIWQKHLEELSQARIELKVGSCDNVAKECLKAQKIYAQIGKLQKDYPFNRCLMQSL